MLTLSLGTLFWKREPLLEHRQAQMNMSSALGDVLERPQQHGSRCLWDRPICLCTLSTLASCNARMNPVPSESSQAELLIGRVFLEISSTARSFHIKPKINSKVERTSTGVPTCEISAECYINDDKTLVWFHGERKWGEIVTCNWITEQVAIIAVV